MLRFRPLLPVLLTAISVSACGGSDEQTPVLPVQQASVLEATFTDDIDTVSTLEANELVELAAQTSGRVTCLLYTSPSPRDRTRSRMPSSA